MCNKNDLARRAAEKWCGHSPSTRLAAWVACTVTAAGVLLALIAAAHLCAGCEHIGDLAQDLREAFHDDGGDAAAGADAGNSSGASPSASASRSGSSGGGAAQDVPAATGDAPPSAAASAAALDWRYGGFKGGGAEEDPRCRLSGLKVGRDSLSLHWDTTIPGDWARDESEKGRLVVIAAFYQAADGRWIGGKFDWIDETRASRPLENIKGGYGGWDGAAWAAARRHAVCVVSADGRRRSNLATE